MSFAMFVTWVLVGVLAGVVAGLVVKHGGRGLKHDVILGLAGSIGASWMFRATGVAPDAGILAMAFVAAAGAALTIAVQRRFVASDRPAEETGVLWRWGFGAALLVAVAWMVLAPTPPPPATAAVIEDRSYPVTPSSMPVKAGVLTGELADLKVTERVERDSGRVATEARLTGKLILKNGTANQTVRLVSGKILYLDAAGDPIALEGVRAEPLVKFASSDRLDPGQETTEMVEVEFPAAALQAKTLKEIGLDLAYVVSPFRQERVRVGVTIGSAK